MTTSISCEGLLRAYLVQLQDEFITTPLDHACSIVTPFLRPDGQAVEIMAQQDSSGQIRLSDMGDTLGYLYVNGLTLSRAVLESARQMCRRFGTSLQGTALVIQPQREEEIGEALHKLIQTTIAVTDLVQKRRPTQRVNFEAEVESLIILSGGVYDTDYLVQGKRSRHSIRFHVNTLRHSLIQPLSAPSEPIAFSWAERWAYRFTDIREGDPSWRCAAVLDDRGARSDVWSRRSLSPLEEYVILWRDRDQLADMVSS